MKRNEEIIYKEAKVFLESIVEANTLVDVTCVFIFFLLEKLYVEF